MKVQRTEPFRAETGRIYRNHGGGTYVCLMGPDEDGGTAFMNTKSGWALTAHGVKMYPDGSIEWDWSSGGHFEPMEQDLPGTEETHRARGQGKTGFSFYNEVEAAV